MSTYHPALPSEIVHTKYHGEEVAADQQGATQPGSGSVVPADEEHSANAHVERHLHEHDKLPFKERMKAYAMVCRGTLLPGHEAEKVEGQKILTGDISAQHLSAQE
ncbi:hypothetical protein CTheo_2624 [Ceratobasidium theobromae]|uniref:Uncharacterized protein n=1 Tax=Ceratobasidium theobromae TaxID=1582974 RepID=A0A5N5QQK4_9AGAM|nr:hypothetical protein CTheo_2624 [Ceratobasidium theobromae]